MAIYYIEYSYALQRALYALKPFEGSPVVARRLLHVALRDRKAHTNLEKLTYPQVGPA